MAFPLQFLATLDRPRRATLGGLFAVALVVFVLPHLNRDNRVLITAALMSSRDSNLLAGFSPAPFHWRFLTN
jgi:hypothetical protein